MSTVKVPRSLRVRISRDAATTGQTAAGFLSTVIDRWERDHRLAEVRRAYESRDENDDEETSAWNATDGDGLDD